MSNIFVKTVGVVAYYGVAAYLEKGNNNANSQAYNPSAENEGDHVNEKEVKMDDVTDGNGPEIECFICPITQEMIK